MLLRDYTKPELDSLVAKCNFTDNELQYFMLKSKDKSNTLVNWLYISTQTKRNIEEKGYL